MTTRRGSRGGVSPTLNAFNNANENRATVVTVYEPAGMVTSEWRESDVKNPIRANERSTASHVVVQTVIPISSDALRGEGIAETPSPDAEGRVRLRDPGLGVGQEGDPAYTLNATGPSVVAVTEDKTHALTSEGADASEDGTGRGTPIIAFDSKSHAQDAREGLAPTLRSMNEVDGNANGGGQLAVVVPKSVISVSNDSYPVVMEEQVGALKVGSGLGIPSAPAIAFSHTQGLDAQPSETAFPTLRSEGGGHAVAFDEMDFTTGETRHTLRAGTRQSTGVETTSTVRRLTPKECERLQGFPDDWTAERYDFKKGEVVAQADSARYKQMGNAVAVPVFKWVMRRLVEVASRDTQAR